MIFVTSPRMVVAHLLNTKRMEKLSDIQQESILVQATKQCRKLGVVEYIHSLNRQIHVGSKACNAGKRPSWLPEKTTTYRQLCAIFTMANQPRMPFTSIQLCE